MSAAAAGTMEQGPVAMSPPERADLGAWLGVAAGALGSLMATLDISIVNSSLPIIQGEIGVTSAEGTWIATAYLVAEIIVIPLTGWLERVLGLRRFLLIVAILFTGFSTLCGLSTTLAAMIVGRVGQGLSGGAMIPTAMTIIATQLPRSQQAIGTALFGATIILGPVAGPVVGGWLTENLSWHYAFFVNVPICAILITLLIVGLPSRRMRLGEIADADWLGIGGLVMGLGSLTVILEEGHRELWFESSLIRWLTIAMIAGFAMIAIGQRTARRPVVKLSLLRDRGFAATMLMSLMLGAVLFGTAFVIPQFLAAVSGYNALQSGVVMLWAGVPAILMMPFLPVLVTRTDVRVMTALGFLCMAASCWFDSGLTIASGSESFLAGQLVGGIGQSISLMFLNQAAIGSVAAEDASDAASLFNAARNLGGSTCLALLATLQDHRMEFHRWNLHSTLQANDPAVQDWIGAASSAGAFGLDGPAASYQMIDHMITGQAVVMSFNDIFHAIAIGVVLITALAFLLKPLPKGSGFMVMH